MKLLESNPNPAVKNLRCYDVILDNGQFLPYVASADGQNAAFMIVGGHDGILEFNMMPDFSERTVTTCHLLGRIHGIPFVGKALRRHWATKNEARIEKPEWFPNGPGATWNI